MIQVAIQHYAQRLSAADLELALAKAEIAHLKNELAEAKNPKKRTRKEPLQ